MLKNKYSSQSGFAHLFLVLVIAAILAAIGYIGYKVYKNQDKNLYSSGSYSAKQSNEDQNSSDPFLRQYGQKCQNRDVKFTSPPMALNDLGVIRPLGQMLDGHVTPTDHVYVVPANQNAADSSIPVLMPADGKIVEVDEMPAQYIGDRQGQQTAPEDHRIVIAHSCRYFSILIHVHKLSDKLHAVVGDQQPNTQKQTDIDLKAGEVIGYDGPSGNDWTPIDMNAKLSFITPKLYEGEPWKIHTVSPFDLYSGSLKSQLEAKSPRKVAPIGGKIDYDQAGKLIGNWFREGTNGYAGANQDRYWDGHLSVVPDNVDPSKIVVSIGNWQGSAAQMYVKGNADPSKVDASSGLIKYELNTVNGSFAGTIAFQVMNGEKLKVEKFPGKSAAQINAFTSSVSTYER